MIDFTPEQNAAFEEGEYDDCSLLQFDPSGWNKSGKTEAEKYIVKKRARIVRHGIFMPYEKKVSIAKKVIEKAFNDFQDKKWAVSFSGGKDSSVLSHLVLSTGRKIDHIFSNTRMEHTETIAAVAKAYKKLRKDGVSCYTARPDIRPKDLWKKHGYPLFGKEISQMFHTYKCSGMKSKKISRRLAKKYIPIFDKLIESGINLNDKCCRELKEKPIKKLCKKHGITANFVGVRTEESDLRALVFMSYGHIVEGKSRGRMSANPLSLWTEKDIYRYMDENNIVLEKINNSSGRSGCKTCMFGCQMAKINALQHLHKSNPKMWEVALDDWGYREILDLLEIDYHYPPEQLELFKPSDDGKFSKL